MVNGRFPLVGVMVQFTKYVGVIGVVTLTLAAFMVELTVRSPISPEVNDVSVTVSARTPLTYNSMLLPETITCSWYVPAGLALCNPLLINSL